MSVLTPLLPGLIGGSLLGASAVVLLLTTGEIMGLSGIMNATFVHPQKTLQDPKQHWKIVFVSTFCLTVSYFVNHVEDVNRDPRMETADDVPIASYFAHILGGFFVGLGTKLGNGCTTGHGICGMGRLSKRSMVAVVTFTGVSIATTFLIGPKQAWSQYTRFLRTDSLPVFSKALGTGVTALAVGVGLLRSSFVKEKKEGDTSSGEGYEKKVIGGAATGLLFALGLTISGMTKKSKVHDFLCPMAIARGTFDPSLIAVLASAIGVSWLGYLFVDGYGIPQTNSAGKLTMKKPVWGSDWSVPTNTVVDKQLVAGASLFGFGWALTGFCPGPALYHFAAGFSDVVLFWIPSFTLGSYMGEKIKAYIANNRK